MDEIKDSDWLSKLENQEYVLKAPKIYVERYFAKINLWDFEEEVC